VREPEEPVEGCCRKAVDHLRWVEDWHTKADQDWNTKLMEDWHRLEELFVEAHLDSIQEEERQERVPRKKQRSAKVLHVVAGETDTFDRRLEEHCSS